MASWPSWRYRCGPTLAAMTACVFGEERVDDGTAARSASSAVTVISTRLQVERIMASATPSRDFQVGQRGGQGLLGEGQALPDFDGRGLVADACDEQFHWL